MDKLENLNCAKVINVIKTLLIECIIGGKRVKKNKLICFTLILAFLAVPFANHQFTPVTGVFEFTDVWDYQGILNRQNHRIKYHSSFVIDPYLRRTFVFCLDSVDDEVKEITTIVAMHGIGPLRNAPLHSLFFEISSLGGKYGFNVSAEAGMSWYDVYWDSDVINASTVSYEPAIANIYNVVLTSTQYSLPELYDVSDHLIFPVHIANFVSQTGIVGHWQQINKDQTVINGNFTTFGPDNPIFTGPINETDPTDIAYPEEDWWPQYNITVAQNVQRTSLPRTHSFQIDFPFTVVLASFALALVVVTSVRRNRRKLR